MTKVISENSLALNTRVELDKKVYIVISCRKLIPFLGEPEGFLLELKEENETRKN